MDILKTDYLTISISACMDWRGKLSGYFCCFDEKGIAVSTGSACSSNDKTSHTSHVLQAIGLSQFEARGAIRVSLGRFNTEENINKFFEIFSQCLLQLNPIFGN